MTHRSDLDRERAEFHRLCEELDQVYRGDKKNLFAYSRWAHSDTYKEYAISYWGEDPDSRRYQAPAKMYRDHAQLVRDKLDETKEINRRLDHGLPTFIPEDIFSRPWLKTRLDNGVRYVIEVTPVLQGTRWSTWDGEVGDPSDNHAPLREREVANLCHSWEGTWRIEQGQLVLIINGCYTHISASQATVCQGVETCPVNPSHRVSCELRQFPLINKDLANSIPSSREHLSFEPAAPRFPGRDDLPIIGPRHFVKAVTAILDELEEKAPHRYREAIEYLPEARWDDTLGNARANSGGKFRINVEDPHFPHTFLHEVGHNVAGHGTTKRDLSKEDKEREAFAYEDMVIAELGRQPRTHPRQYRSLISIAERIDLIANRRRGGYELPDGAGRKTSMVGQPGGFSKHPLDRERLIAYTWHKSNEWGQHFTVRFNSDGTLSEAHTDSPEDAWSGTWQVDASEGALVTRVGPYEVVYVSLNKQMGLLEGIELSYDDPERRVTFQLTRQ